MTLPVVLICAGVLWPALLGAVGLRWWLYRSRQRRLTADGVATVILVPPSVEAGSAEQFWGHLGGLVRPWWQRLTKGQPHLAFEYRFTSAGLTVRLWAPRAIPPALLRQAVESAWPGAQVRREEPAAAEEGRLVAVGGELRLARPEALPLKTSHGSDPLRALLGAGLGAGDGAQVTVSVLARPAAARRVRRAKHQLHRLGGGPGRSPRGGRDPEQGGELRSALAKFAGPQWETAVRYCVAVVAGPQAPSRATIRAHAIASAFAVHAGRNWYVRRRLRQPVGAVGERRFPLRGDLLSVPELAAVAHLPTDATTPGVQRAGARSVQPVPVIPCQGPSVRPLGIADAGPARPVGLAVPDGRYHTHVLGSTGSGKSTLLAGMILADVRAGRGTLVVDPKGDLVLDLLDRLPEAALERTVLIDPDDHGLPPRLNVLEGEVDTAVDNLVGIFQRIFSSSWGPRTDDLLRASCLSLMTSSTAGVTVTLADVPLLLTDSAYRRRISRGVNDRMLRGFWTWYDELSDPARAATTAPLMNKLRAFLLRPFVQQSVASGPSTFDLGAVLDGGVALVRLPKGALGQETAGLYGSFIVAKAWQAATRRASQAEHTRRDAVLYLDEAQHFLNLPYPLEDMLAEARAYRLAYVLAHQNLGQLPRDLREGIAANARNKITFAASPDDARDLERHTRPHLAAHDLAHLGRYQAAARLVVDATTTPAFTLRTTALPPPVPGLADRVRHASRANFGPEKGK
ncbi:type IV secretory system conjugative DNA transfer family protein [Kitasatospora viridis]|uniref:Type IV secretion system coupling TraD/TrwB family protein n=1 Tax=Kitasatospora viridis TaxID=281105 RepID=A0A561TW41_9ACTN|nr:type IV secretion system DNA-binding domain-containing protein [Kitasatospora viridis]TWF91336.1 type IV secretion system coupling TraD/TrwB family protein [Kitasatospora viridis]